MNFKVSVQLSLLMFFQFFIWGAWFVTMGTFLSQVFNSTGSELSLAYETQSIGAIIAPFIIGLIADKYFAAQKVLGTIHLFGAFLLYNAGVSENFSHFYPYILIYMLLYMPTLALANSVAFRQMKDPSKEFAPIRIFGSIGWIIAGLLIGYFSWESLNTLKNTFYMSSFVSLILGVYSFTLPNTPPIIEKNKNKTISQIIGLDALKILNDKAYLVFFIASILICIPLAFYYQHANQFLNEIGMEAAAAKMTLGQISEVLFLSLLPFFIKRFGFKSTLIVGIFAWGLRYLLFSLGADGINSWMLILGIILHGICYDFFFVSGQIYTNLKCKPEYKSSAQGLITLATYGLGMLIGFRIAGYLTDLYVISDGHDWEKIWIQPSIFSFVILILFIFTFRNEKIETKIYE
ncbi:MAG: nucleoside permease [Flavobacteriaceae bacterium]|tara:strand:- start:1751 stop:2965 length:1215 start_codon:yes stop_codon:yes gene_type:complete